MATLVSMQSIMQCTLLPLYLLQFTFAGICAEIVGHGYFNAFCNRIHKILRDKVHYAFSSAYSIDPGAATTEPHAIPAKPGDIEGENNRRQSIMYQNGNRD